MPEQELLDAISQAQKFASVRAEQDRTRSIQALPPPPPDPKSMLGRAQRIAEDEHCRRLAAMHNVIESAGDVDTIGRHRGIQPNIVVDAPSTSEMEAPALFKATAKAKAKASVAAPAPAATAKRVVKKQPAAAAPQQRSKKKQVTGSAVAAGDYEEAEEGLAMTTDGPPGYSKTEVNYAWTSGLKNPNIRRTLTAKTAIGKLLEQQTQNIGEDNLFGQVPPYTSG